MNIKYQISNIKYIGTLLFLFSFIFAFAGTGPVSASSHCKSMAGQTGTHGPASKIIDQICGNPAQYNQDVRCQGVSGDRYIVTFCRADGCYEEYPEQGPSAPDLCKRPDAAAQSDIGKVFGQILTPQAIQYLGFGATGISKFLSNLVALMYSLAVIVLIFMLLWGAWNWITSEGDKEKLESAKRKIINAIIGIMLFAVAFAIIQVLGTFTGFKFFEGQK